MIPDPSSPVWTNEHEPESTPGWRLLRTLRDRPQLRTYVKELSAKCHIFHTQPGVTWDTIVREIMALVPALESLDLTQYRPRNGLGSYPRISGESEHDHKFRYLKLIHSLKLDAPNAWREYGHSIFAIPNLEILSLCENYVRLPMMEVMHHDWQGLICLLKSLTLDGVDLSFNNQMELAANACPSLESLRIIGHRYMRNVGAQMFRKVMGLFSQHMIEGNLRQLEMWDRIRGSLCDTTFTRTDGLSKIRTYGRLEMVDVDVAVLLEKTPDEVVYLDLQLSKTLRILKLRAGGPLKGIHRKYIPQILDELSESLKVHCPKLRKVVLMYDRIWWGSYADADIQKLEKTFGALGVQFEYLQVTLALKMHPLLTSELRQMYPFLNVHYRYHFSKVLDEKLHPPTECSSRAEEYQGRTAAGKLSDEEHN